MYIISVIVYYANMAAHIKHDIKIYNKHIVRTNKHKINRQISIVAWNRVRNSRLITFPRMRDMSILYLLQSATSLL